MKNRKVFVPISQDADLLNLKFNNQ